MKDSWRGYFIRHYDALPAIHKQREAVSSDFLGAQRPNWLQWNDLKWWVEVRSCSVFSQPWHQRCWGIVATIQYPWNCKRRHINRNIDDVWGIFCLPHKHCEDTTSSVRWRTTMVGSYNYTLWRHDITPCDDMTLYLVTTWHYTLWRHDITWNRSS